MDFTLALLLLMLGSDNYAERSNSQKVLSALLTTTDYKYLLTDRQKSSSLEVSRRMNILYEHCLQDEYQRYFYSSTAVPHLYWFRVKFIHVESGSDRTYSYNIDYDTPYQAYNWGIPLHFIVNGKYILRKHRKASDYMNDLRNAGYSVEEVVGEMRLRHLLDILTKGKY